MPTGKYDFIDEALQKHVGAYSSGGIKPLSSIPIQYEEPGIKYGATVPGSPDLFKNMSGSKTIPENIASMFGGGEASPTT